jgi:hypothetical protein
MVARFSVRDIAIPRAPLGEVRRTFELLELRRENGNPDYRPPELAVAHRTLDRFDAGNSHVTVTALSPSAQDHLNAIQAFAGYFVPVDSVATGLSPIDQNHASVVVMIEIAGETLLLGADLETTKSQHTGWNAVVASTIRPQQTSQFFKIPHHGSSTSHSVAVWSRMLDPNVIAVLTPYTPSEVPDEHEVQWLKARNTAIFATGLPERIEIERRREVDKKIKAVTKSFSSYQLPEEPGIVRLRKSPGEAWQSELFGAAIALT